MTLHFTFVSLTVPAFYYILEVYQARYRELTIYLVWPAVLYLYDVYVNAVVSIVSYIYTTELTAKVSSTKFR
jgi:hypothetical protein